MKKLIASILMLCLSVGLCGCGFTDIYSQSTAPSSQTGEIVLNTYMVEITAGEPFQLSNTSESEKELTWTSSNEAVALVDDKGLVTAVAPGVANITCATDTTQSAVCIISVKADPSAPTTETAAPTETAPTTSTQYTPYTTSLSASVIIYDRPSTNGNFVQYVGENGIYTIVEEAYDSAGNLWGRLKSGLGWVMLS